MKNICSVLLFQAVFYTSQLSVTKSNSKHHKTLISKASITLKH